MPQSTVASSILRSPMRILALLLVLVFTAEFGVMLALPFLTPTVLSPTAEAFIDALLLTLVCAPVLWWVMTSAEQAEQRRITMARQTEAMRTQQMATLAQLATGVAHEIRNPLTSIKMLIQVNREKFAGEGFPTDDLVLVEQEIRRMERSVNSLLDYARPETCEFTTFDLCGAIDKTVQLTQARCQSQNVALQVIAPESPIIINAAEPQIRQLMLNLVLNALDAMPDGGNLTILATTNGGDLTVLVSDNGPGIDDAVLAKLFTPFVTTKPNGVGLGLGICRRIAEAHHGTLTAANDPGGGAMFCLTLLAEHH